MNSLTHDELMNCGIAPGDPDRNAEDEVYLFQMAEFAAGRFVGRKVFHLSDIDSALHNILLASLHLYQANARNAAVLNGMIEMFSAAKIVERERLLEQLEGAFEACRIAQAVALEGILEAANKI